MEWTKADIQEAQILRKERDGLRSEVKELEVQRSSARVTRRARWTRKIALLSHRIVVINDLLRTLPPKEVSGRFDIPETVQHVVRIAVEQGIINWFGVHGLDTKHGGDWDGLVRELCEMAFAVVHWNKNAHRAVVEAADEYWKEVS